MTLTGLVRSEILTIMSFTAARIKRLRILHFRSYATSALSPVARAKAEQISAEWKGTSAIGGSTKNYIGGQFLESKADKWIDVLDPVRIVHVTLDRSLIYTL